MIQELLVYLIVAGAVLYLVRMLMGAVVGKKSSCNGCGSNCATQAKKSAQPTLIQISPNELNGHKK